jgi:hypothetical protein
MQVQCKKVWKQFWNKLYVCEEMLRRYVMLLFFIDLYTLWMYWIKPMQCIKATVMSLLSFSSVAMPFVCRPDFIEDANMTAKYSAEL